MYKVYDTVFVTSYNRTGSVRGWSRQLNAYSIYFDGEPRNIWVNAVDVVLVKRYNHLKLVGE